MRTWKVAGAFLAAAALLAGCNDSADSGPSITVDSSLTGRLVTAADFSEGWAVQDISKKMAESEKKTSGEAVPAECDSQDKTSLKSGVGAIVSEQPNTPGVIVALSHENSATLIADTEQWLDKCKTFSVKGADDSSAEATVRRIEPPPSKAGSQVGFEMDTTGRAGTESVHLTVTGYTAQVGDVIVMCLAMGGKGVPPNGHDVIPNVDMLNAVFADQIAKVSA